MRDEDCTFKQKFNTGQCEIFLIQVCFHMNAPTWMNMF